MLDITETELNQIRFLVQRILIPLLVTIGIITNLINIVILTKSARFRCWSYMYLISIASANVVYLIFRLLLSFQHYQIIHHLKFKKYWQLVGIYHWFCDASTYIFMYLVFCLSVERYITISQPFNPTYHVRTKKIIIGIIIFCFLSTVSTAFEYNLKVSRCKSIVLIRSKLGSNLFYNQIFLPFTFLVFSLFPLIVITIFNILLIRSLRYSRSIARNDTTKKKFKIDDRINFILISMVLIFLCCQIPCTVILFCKTFWPLYRKSRLLLFFGNLSNFFQSLNATGNFIIYFLTSTQYRETLKELMNCKIKQKKNNVKQRNIKFSADTMNMLLHAALRRHHMQQNRKTSFTQLRHHKKGCPLSNKMQRARSLESIPQRKFIHHSIHCQVQLENEHTGN